LTQWIPAFAGVTIFIELIPSDREIGKIYNHIMKEKALHISHSLGLTAYQSYILGEYGYKYNLRRVRKIAGHVYAPYRCDAARGFRDAIKKMIYGPRADLIGPDCIVAYGERRINIDRILNSR